MIEQPVDPREDELEVALAIGAFLLGQNHENAALFGRISYAALTESAESDEQLLQEQHAT